MAVLTDEKQFVYDHILTLAKFLSTIEIFIAWARRVHSSESRTRDLSDGRDTVLGTRFSLFQAEPMRCSACGCLSPPISGKNNKVDQGLE